MRRGALALAASALSVLATIGRADTEPRPRPAEAGAVCGDPSLVGTPEPAIVAEGGCGVAEPVRLSSAEGVALEPAPLVDCATARALAVWLRVGPLRIFAQEGERVAALAVADAYSCRNRNRAAAGKLSEHARGRAIDVSGFRLADGSVIALREGWGSPDHGPALRAIHGAACGPFGTVLGPDANALHADHLHFDVAARQSGPWCE